MPDICIYITNVTSPNPYTTMAVDYEIMVNGHAAFGGQTTYVGFDDTASVINESLISDAVTYLPGQSITVSATDSRRVIGGFLAR